MHNLNRIFIQAEEAQVLSNLLERPGVLWALILIYN